MLIKPEPDKLDENGIKNALQNTVAGSLIHICSLSDGMFMVEMQNTEKENILELMHQWSAREDVLSVSPVYLDEYGEIAGGYTNKIVVRLKSKDDCPVLQKSAGAYSIKDIKPDEFDELVYILTLPDARKNALQIANELHETGLFQYAVPDLVIFAKLGSNDTYFTNQRGPRNESSLFTVCPNPANDVLYIDIDRQTMDNPACEFSMYSLNGSKALQTATNGNKATIDVSVLQNGIYFLHIYDTLSGKQEIRKIVIKH
jgi:hypothetical protein